MSENNENNKSENTDEKSPDNSDSKTTNELNSALQDITSSMPKVSDHVVKLQQDEQAEKEQAQKQEEAPQPKKRKRGRPRKNPQGKKTTAKSKTPEPKTAQQTPNPQQLTEAQSRQIAVMTASAIVEQTGVLFGGSDARFQDQEKMMIEVSFEKYMESKGISDFPPGIALAVGLGTYYARVITTKPAQGRLVKGFQWLKSKFKFKKGSKNASYADRRNDNVGQDNTSETDSARL